MPDTRYLNIEDVPRLESLAEQFYAEGNLPGELDFDVFQGWWKKWLSDGSGIIIAAEDDGEILGVIGGLFGNAVTTGALELNEMFWFMGENARGQGVGKALLQAFIHAGKSAGAEGISMVHLCDEVGDRLSEAFKGLGFRPLEVRYYMEN